MEKNPIALNIRRLRQSRHWSQEELAAASGVDVRTIQRAESGRPLALESLKALAAGFDTTIDALSASPEDVTRLLDEFREKYSLIGLRPLQAAADLQTFLPQADAFLLQRIGTMSDEQADEVAIFEQEFKDYGDLWRELEPVQRREAERHFQPIIERLWSLDLSVSLGTDVMNLRLQTGGPSVRFSTLYVAVVPGSTALRFLAREKGQPVQFA
jgi:transcriptional regulator with XRE-family HTH domain